MTAFLQSTGISKSFRGLQALREVSLNVGPGETVALLGHNGAGKTTLFRIILGFLQPDSGSITVDGQAPGSAYARRMISYLPENVAFPKMLTGREIVTFYAKLRSAPPGQIPDVLEKVDLADAADRRCGTYSKGMRQRLGLAQALVGQPKLLLLDEPTSGLDPLSRQRFYTLISDVAASGTAVLLSSHGLSELEARTDRVAILRRGRLVANGPLESLQRQADLPIRIRVRAKPGHVDSVHAQLGGARINCSSVEFVCRAPEKMSRLAAIHGLGDAIDDMDVILPSLDQVYRHFSLSGNGAEEAS